MRLSLRRAVHWVLALVIFNVVVYYWTVSVKRQDQKKDHPYLQPLRGDVASCSIKRCPAVKEGYLNVHLVPHSHIDVGWLKSVENYYSGQDESMTMGCVKCTLDSVLEELKDHPDRRFIFAEMKYFSRYWSELSTKQRAFLEELIKTRRLEIINGGWVMSDAAVTLYKDIIDQHTLGFDFIREHFGPCAQSRTGWHVDQFGHTREHAHLFTEMGYDSLVIGRIDFQDHANRKLKKNLEFLWKTSPDNIGDKGQLFTHITFDGYYSPNGFVFEAGGAFGLNGNKRFDPEPVASFKEIIRNRAMSYSTDHIMMPMGCDFGYQTAKLWFDSMDALMNQINSEKVDKRFPSVEKPLNLIYSTPSCYTHYVHRANKTYLSKSDDFHPYSIDPGVYWTGYFTTRAGLKLHIWRAGQILQSCKQLSIFTNLFDTFDPINDLRDTLAIMQHHDAITGTQQLHVLNDYNKLLSEGESRCETVMGMAYRKLMLTGTQWTDQVELALPSFCPHLNISECPISEKQTEFLTTVYNPLGWPVSTWVQLPVQKTKLTISDGTGSNVPFQLLPVSQGIKNIPERTTASDVNVVFHAELPPLSVTSFRVTAKDGGGDKPAFEKPKGIADIIIENEHLKLTFNGKTGLLASMVNKAKNLEEKMSQELLYYEPLDNGERSSGAYLFVPKSEKPERIRGRKRVDIQVVRGDLVEEVHQMFSSWAWQVVRLYKGAQYAEFEWVVGPLTDDKDENGKEVISRFTSELKSFDQFYTDSNAKEMMRRVRKKPPPDTDMNVKVDDYLRQDPVSSNYYPITNRIFIQDKSRNLQLTVLPDRPQGGSSLASGSLELMVHRLTKFDDSLGVGEPLEDEGVDHKGIRFSGKHWVCLDTIEASAELTKRLGFQRQLAPTLMFSLPPKEDNLVKSFTKQHTFLNSPLPPNVHLLTLDRITMNNSNLLLLRLEHVFEKNEPTTWSKPATVSLETLFRGFDIISAEETSLGGNFNPKDISRLRWKSAQGKTPANIGSEDYKAVMEPPFTILLQPMEIRTFRVQIAKH